MNDAVFVEHVVNDVFRYIIEIEGDMREIEIVFENGNLHTVDDAEIRELDLPAQTYWETQGRLAQLVSNCLRKIGTPEGDYPQPDEDTPVAIKEPYDSGIEVVNADKTPFYEQTSKVAKQTEDEVVRARRYFRNPRNRNLVMEAEAERRGISATALKYALTGKTWKSVNDVEPPLTEVEYRNALAYPKQ